MSHMLLIVEPAGQRVERGEAQGRVVYQQMVDFAADLKRRGKLRAVESLVSPDASAARVQRRGGASQVLDGPFAEAKEMIGGFYLLENTTRDEAVRIAAECPAAAWATIEVRALGPCYT